jgi:hypothetical protein
MLRPVTWRSRAAQGLAVGVLLLAGGCSLGGGDGDSPDTARGPAKEVAELIAALERATGSSDWRAVCDELFTRDARQRAGGRDCPRLLRSAAGDLRGARIELTKLTIKDDRVDAQVRSRARGQGPLVDTVQVVRERGRYRIDSLR